MRQSEWSLRLRRHNHASKLRMRHSMGMEANASQLRMRHISEWSHSLECAISEWSHSLRMRHSLKCVTAREWGWRRMRHSLECVTAWERGWRRMRHSLEPSPSLAQEAVLVRPFGSARIMGEQWQEGGEGGEYPEEWHDAGAAEWGWSYRIYKVSFPVGSG